MPIRNAGTACAAVLGTLCYAADGYAQSPAAPAQLPPVNVEAPAAGALTVPTPEVARELIERTPGAVEVVPREVWRDTPSATLKDMLDYTPGVFVQPKWGEDSRLSIRGSGLSRNFHMRGIQLYQDGIPYNASDGSADFQELDPTAFNYVEVYKGANALRFGASSLGGALNFVTPTGYGASPIAGRADVGSFGFYRFQASTGGHQGAVDGFFTGSYLTQDGFRDHSDGHSLRGYGNFGWRIADNVETRFYVTFADIEQHIPGSVTKTVALNNPRQAAAANLIQNYQRNMQSFRLANKTTITTENTVYEFGAYLIDKHLIHPIYQYLDYRYHDFGGFGRLTDERQIAGHTNRFTLGLNLFGGWIDNEQYQNLPGGNKGTLLSQSKDSSMNVVVYGENAFDLVPSVSFITGLQFVYASRERKDELPTAPDTSGDAEYTFLNPKVGLLWQVDPGWQVFGNVSRSAEPPTFAELNFTNAALSDTKAQRAWTFEIGTRGRRPDFTWDVALYRANLRNEYQYFDLGGGNYQVTNADKTIHQGLELGAGVTVWKGIFARSADPDRLWLNLAYTFSDFRFDGDPAWGDNELPGAPRHYLRAELLYRNPAGFYAGPNVEWVPQAYYVDNANTTKTEAYALLGFRAGYELNRNVSLFVDARNLTDEKYIASASVAAVANQGSPLFEPGTGRAVYGGIQMRW